MLETDRRQKRKKRISGNENEKSEINNRKTEHFTK